MSNPVSSPSLRAVLLVASLFLSSAARADGMAIGTMAPPLVLPSLADGGKVSLQSLAGQVIYVDFWASWCGPCRVSFPILESLRRELGQQGFEVLAVSVDESESDAREFLQQVPVSYPVVIDGSGATPRDWGILGMPTGFLIDREGTVRHIHQGFKKRDGEQLRAMIVQLL